MEPQTPDDADQGVVFPRTGETRSTTATGRAVFADAARAVDGELAARIEAERDWRRRYVGHARALMAARLAAPARGIAVPSAGLDSLHRRFAFVRDGDEMRLHEALDRYEQPQLRTATVHGSGEPEAELSLPYRGQRLRGDELHRQLDRWVEGGVVEPSFADAVRLVMANPDWLDLSDTTVAVVGAGAEMGPLHSLMRWRATVLPLDLDRPAVWRRILAVVRGGAAVAHVPVRRELAPDASDEELARAAGVDLVTSMPEAATWLDGFDGPLTLGNYVYADGATNVRVAMAVDAITARMLQRRDDVSIAVLATPTDVFAVPEEVVADARRRLSSARLPVPVRGAARALTGGRLFVPNYPDVVTTPEGLRLGVADCLVAQQGPNYALAKRLQRWRASVARHDGVVTSVNVAPPTRTRSVLRNRVLAAAYAGANAFGVEVFDPSTSNTLMAALLVHDLRNPKATAHPETPLQHPLELLWTQANHGGLWRNPFSPRSILGLAVVLGMLQRGA